MNQKNFNQRDFEFDSNNLIEDILFDIKSETNIAFGEKLKGWEDDNDWDIRKLKNFIGLEIECNRQILYKILQMLFDIKYNHPNREKYYNK